MDRRFMRLLVPLVALCACGTAQALKLATIGDFGDGSSNEARVANMVNSWGVDDVLALGDCNYPYGESATIDPHVGAFYARYIAPYKGTYGSGSANGNHFWPIPGNHDYGNTCGDNKAGCTCTGNPSILQAYLGYMPTQGRAYYTQVLGGGLVEVFAIDSDCNQVDGTGSTSVQANWIKSKMAASTATWKIVMIHHSPFSSSSNHGSITRVQWPFQSWGADFVLSGHDHDYERILMPGGFPYIVNGIGGAGIYGFGTPVTGSAVRYSTQHGAQLIDINATTAILSFYAATSPQTLIDCYAINKPVGGGVATYSSCDGGSPPPSPPPAGTSYSLLTGAAASNTAGTHSIMPWRFTSAATQLAAGWETEAFDASAWQVGRTRFGYGPDLPWNTSLPIASTGLLHHYFRSSFCLSAARRTWLNSLSLSLKVMADNGADVYLNGAKLVADSASNHDVLYWNNIATVLGNSANFKQGVNWLAAYVSNNAGSSDAGFDLDLQFDAAGANPEVPDAPLSPAAPSITASSVTLSWSKPVCDGSSFVTSYTIASSPAVSVPAVAVTDPWQASYTSTISGLAPCTTYTFSIAAVNAAGASTPATVTATTSCVVNPTYSLITATLASNDAATRPNIFWRFTSAATQLAAGWETEAFDASAWPVGRTRFGYGPDLPWNTSLPDTSGGLLHHYFRSSFCLSAARRTWLNSLSLTLKVMADNGADVYLNGAKLVADSASNHDVLYWNNIATVLGNSANFKQGVNWLAAYVSNNAGSSDAGFDLDLQFDAAGANPEVPDAPLSPAAPSITASSVTLSWSKPVCDGSSFVTSYTIASSPAVSVPAVAVTNPWQASYTSTISGLAPCTTYTFSIAAVNAAGASTPATVTAKTTGCVTVGTYSLLTADVASNNAATRPNIFWRYTSVASKLTTVWYSSTFDASAWPVGRTRFGYGPDLPWNTSLPSAVTTKLYHHYFRSSFCLSAARRTWLNSLSLSLKVMADNGADVYLNGAKLVADSASNHDVLYWNNVKTVLGSSANFKQGVNWLAAYVSNTAGSSDAGFDLDLQFDAAGANPQVPDAPLSPAAPSITASSVTLSWSKPVCDGSSFVTSYTIASSPAVSVPAVAVTNPWQASYTSTISGLAPCTTYTFSIAAVNAAGASTPATVTTRTSGCLRRRRAANGNGM